jgi:hypothetical protein
LHLAQQSHTKKRQQFKKTNFAIRILVSDIGFLVRFSGITRAERLRDRARADCHPAAASAAPCASDADVQSPRLLGDA